jgi:hypothetical protein
MPWIFFSLPGEFTKGLIGLESRWQWQKCCYEKKSLLCLKCVNYCRWKGHVECQEKHQNWQNIGLTHNTFYIKRLK